MALSSEFVQEAKRRLEEELKTVERELVDLGFPPDGAVDVSFDEGFADAAQTASERSKVLSIAEGLRNRVEDVRGALSRIERGVYGICESCGKEIAIERLEAIPAASLCIDCKQKQKL